MRLVRNRLRPSVEANTMSIDYVLGAIVSVGLLVYLVYALIRPEKF
jgi:K+-transporting ATPase KdpF subunit